MAEPIYVALTIASGWVTVYLLVQFVSIWWPDFGSVREGPGVYYRFGFISWTTNSLNATFLYYGQKYKRVWSWWFSAGVAFGFCASIAAVVILVANLLRVITASSAKNQILTPMVPGVNVPMTHLWYFFFTLLIAGVWHEFGHALAAISEGRIVRQFGVFTLAIYPGAFVNISDDLHVLTPFRQLKIFCAGVWHNFVLTVLAYLLVTGSGFVFAPIFAPAAGAGGAIVADVISGSALENQFFSGDRIVQINHYPIESLQDWELAFKDMYEKKFEAQSVCTSADTVLNAKGVQQNLGCCSESYAGSLQCWKTTSTGEEKDKEKQEAEEKNFCFAASKIVKVDSRYCSSKSDCGANEICVKPVCPPGHMILNFVKSTGDNVLFSAHPISVYRTIIISKFENRWSIFSDSLLVLPVIWDKFWRYMVTISLALSVLNIAPAFWLDGDHALKAFVRICLPGWTETNRMWLSELILRSTAILFIVNIVASFLGLFV